MNTDEELDKILVNLYLGDNTTEKMPNWKAQMQNPELSEAKQAIAALLRKSNLHRAIDELGAIPQYFTEASGVSQFIQSRIAELQAELQQVEKGDV